jgi:hypothetical protein
VDRLAAPGDRFRQRAQVGAHESFGDQTSLPGLRDDCRRRASALRSQELRLVAVALVSRERSPKAKALVRTDLSDAAIWLLPAFSGSVTLGREPT